MLENDEPGTACRDVEDGEDSEFDCRSRCRMTMIRVSTFIASTISHFRFGIAEPLPLTALITVKTITAPPDSTCIRCHIQGYLKP